jgi:hypothetical protein
MLPKDVILSRSGGKFTDAKRNVNEPKRVNSFNQLTMSDSKLLRSSENVSPPHRHKSPTTTIDSRRPWIPSSTHASQSSVEIQIHPPAHEVIYANLIKPRKLQLQKESLPNHLRARRTKGKKPLALKQLNNPSDGKPKTAMKKKRAIQKEAVLQVSEGIKTAEILGDISIRVLEATKNLEHMSKHLLEVAESLSESALLNLSNDRHQSKLISDSALVNDSNLPATSTMVFPVESNDNSSVRKSSARAPEFDGIKSHSAEVRNISSPTDFHETSIANGKDHPEVISGMLDISQMSEFTSQDVNFITDMVRRRMHAKLKGMLESQLGIVNGDSS